MDHLSHADYLAVLRGEVPPALLPLKTRQHLGELRGTMPTKAGSRGLSHSSSATGFVSAKGLVEWLDLPGDRRALSHRHLEACERLLSEVHAAARLARVDLGRLTKLPMTEWRGRVVRARSRMRSRAFAVLLIKESRRRVRTAAAEAEELAALVRPALDRWPGRLDEPWARALVASATAHRANAVRVAGDLRRAGSLFGELEPTLQAEDFPDRAILAEILSLQASLRIDQRRFDIAGRLLERTAEYARHEKQPVLLARTMIQQANIERAGGDPARAEGLLSEASTLIDPATEPELYFGTVHGRITSLLELDRPLEAEDLLAARRDLYFSGEEKYLPVVHTFLQAWVDLSLGRIEAAVAGFTTARDRFLDLGRSYDAVMTCLYLADTYLAAGDFQRLHRLAASLVPMFQSRGVEREALAALRLLVQGAATESVTASLVDEVRRRLREEGGTFLS